VTSLQLLAIAEKKLRVSSVFFSAGVGKLIRTNEIFISNGKESM